jgi:hypothetical protein
MAESFGNANGFGPTLSDGSFVSGGGKGETDYVKMVLELGKGGLTYLQGRQNTIQANAYREAEALRNETEKLKEEGSGNRFAQQIALGRLSTTRVIVFGLIGVAVIGTAIYFFTRKKA